MPAVWLNMDLGEIESEPEELYALATQVNVACGGHAGDDASMRRAVALAARSGARLAAHPSYPDRAGFGRRRLDLSWDALAGAVAQQCAQLRAIAAEVGLEVVGVKPHGELYHAAARDAVLAKLLLAGATSALDAGGLAVVGPPEGELARVAALLALRYEREGFADRGYRDDGSLVPRGEAGALIVDPAAAAAQAVRLAETGGVETICVHGDTEGAVDVARVVRRALEAARLLAGAAP